MTKALQIVDELQRELQEFRGKPETPARQQMEEMTKPADAHAILDAIQRQKD